MAIIRRGVSSVIKNRAVVLPIISDNSTYFHPFDIGDPALWLDSSDTSKITLVSTKVSQISDKSGNGFHFVQTSDSSRPVYSGTQNGRNTMVFSGNQHMTCSFTGVSNIGGFSAFVVNQYDETSNDGFFVTSGYNVRHAHFNDRFYSGAGNTKYAFFTDSDRKNSWNQYTIVFDGSLSGNENRLKTYLNGSQKTIAFFNGTIGTTTDVDSGLTYLGSYLSGASEYTGKFAEIIIYPFSVTATQLALVENYQIKKWGIV